jgi:hypothetical protein
VATVRAVWTAVEGAGAAEQAKLKRDITQTVNRLKSRVEGRLGKPVTRPKERLLFDVHDEEEEKAPLVEASVPPSAPRFPEPTLRVYAKDFADHALLHLPQAVNCHSVEEFRNYLTDKLRFNSQATRRRSANYIVSRFFPGAVFNTDLPPFAAGHAGFQTHFTGRSQTQFIGRSPMSCQPGS